MISLLNGLRVTSLGRSSSSPSKEHRLYKTPLWTSSSDHNDEHERTSWLSAFKFFHEGFSPAITLPSTLEITGWPPFYPTCQFVYLLPLGISHTWDTNNISECLISLLLQCLQLLHGLLDSASAFPWSRPDLFLIVRLYYPMTSSQPVI